jgi:hypothetical protein
MSPRVIFLKVTADFVGGYLRWFESITYHHLPILNLQSQVALGPENKKSHECSNSWDSV